ncbi:unnamed protein product [Periconia digitata]|uniref:Uncharacterized protein n=1 Tax=Periconia digitata TaxID=1303443 RepID=A0A9W4UBR8_9PLEO|nr:unnamed protein product [Periconia digitata]
MLFSTKTVLSTLAVAGNVAASNLHHGHAQFHAKRDIEKREDYSNVDWKVALKDVDWNTVKYDGSAPAATQAPSSQPEAQVASNPKPTSSAAPVYAPAPAKSSSKAPAASSSSAPSKPDTPSVGDVVGDVIGDFTDAISTAVSAFSKLEVIGNTGLNAKTQGENIWIGSDGKYKMTFTNDDSKDMAVVCWEGEGLWVTKKTPQIFVALKGGKSVTLSIPYGMSGGCAAGTSTSNNWYGLINESILEFTAKDGAMGCFDVSREINQQGIVMTAKGSQCTSGLVGGQLSCVFLCVDKTTQRCEAAKSYGISLGAATEGSCMMGNDPHDDGASGGCQFGTDGEHIQVTVSSSRNWPPYQGELHT